MPFALRPDSVDSLSIANLEYSYHKKPNRVNIDFFAANYYDAVMIFAELLKRVEAKKGKPMNGAELEKAIWENPSSKTVYGGDLRLKKDGSVAKQMVIFKIVDAKLTVAEKVAGE